MIDRVEDHSDLVGALARSPVVLLVGPRQSGKTTLARSLVPAGSLNYFDLEDPDDLARLAEPMMALSPLVGTVVIDQVQRRPDLFPVLRVLVDRADTATRFLVLGSASPPALRQASESLTGRLTVVELGGFRPADVPQQIDRLWLRGGFPRAFLAHDDAGASAWLADYARNLVERDLLTFGIRLPATALRRFLSIVAHYHGQVWNSADPARSLGISDATVRRYLDLLTDALLVRQLAPWHANIAKRQVKAPKIYYRDAGLAHHLLGIDTAESLARHPKSGATWEGMVIEEVLRIVRPPEAYFWATHGGAQLDLLLALPGRSVGVEVKRTDAPSMTPSIRSALVDLELHHIVVIYPGSRTYRLHDRVSVVPAAALSDPAAARETILGGEPN